MHPGQSHGRRGGSPRTEKPCQRSRYLSTSHLWPTRICALIPTGPFRGQSGPRPSGFHLYQSLYSQFRTSHLGTNANHFKKAVTHHTKNKRPRLGGQLIIKLKPRENYVALSALRASWAAFFSRYLSSVRLCQPTQLSVGDRPHVHALIAIASKVFALKYIN